VIPPPSVSWLRDGISPGTVKLPPPTCTRLGGVVFKVS